MKDSTQHPVTSLVIGDVTVLQDEDGRYCLNDLHRAAGSSKRHQVSDWLRLQQTQELIAELNGKGMPGIPGIEAVSAKPRLGTFVRQELVYVYAMWISAPFTLKVIQAYHSMVTAAQGMHLSAGMSMTNWISLFKFRDQVMQNLATCNDRGVADGFYGNLLHVSRVLGLATPPLDTLAPGLRQGALPLGQGGAS
jgi:hypothetical protein